MKEIILNADKLREEEIKIHKRKVRALIIDDQNMITLCKYYDVFMLPGGKIEDFESEQEALLRELKEELGISFDLKDLTQLLKIIHFEKDYPIRNSNKTIDRCCETNYYLIKSNKKMNINKRSLTIDEEKYLEVMYVPFNRILETISNYEQFNQRNKYFSMELLLVLKEYLKVNKHDINIEQKNGLIDLHIHTTFSDGEKSPNEIIEMAIKNGAQTISITDHDNILAYDNLIYDKSKIQVISGIELSANINRGRLHILGYGIDLDNQVFRNQLKILHQNSIDNILMFVDILKKDYAIGFREEDIQKLIKSYGNVGRPDLAKLMIKYGIVQSVQEAFDRYLIDANDKINNKLKKPTYQECFKMIKDAGGIPILAHPHSLLLDNYHLFNYIRKMKAEGLQGLEIYHSNVSKNLADALLKFAIDENLYITGGSDYHGTCSKPDIQLFTGKYNNIKIKQLNILKKISPYHN